jgi:hypothetical protein
VPGRASPPSPVLPTDTSSRASTCHLTDFTVVLVLCPCRPAVRHLGSELVLEATTLRCRSACNSSGQKAADHDEPDAAAKKCGENRDPRASSLMLLVSATNVARSRSTNRPAWKVERRAGFHETGRQCDTSRGHHQHKVGGSPWRSRQPRSTGVS